ncbi:MAG: phage holin family protein [Candidatus Desulforudis sp.]|nr:phage holin family protein [Desulforudis sp.]
MESGIIEYVVTEALILIPALWIIGAFLKKTPYVQDWYIPWVLLALGIGGGLALLGVNPEAVIQGVLVTGAAVLGYQLLKQTVERDG